MEIYVRDNKLRRVVEDEAFRKRELGAEMADKLALRLAALVAAESLADFWPPNSGPERCHELIGDQKGTFSIDLKQPYRLLFESHAETANQEQDEQQRWKSIKAIDVMSIEDTHG